MTDGPRRPGYRQPGFMDLVGREIRIGDRVFTVKAVVPHRTWLNVVVVSDDNRTLQTRVDGLHIWELPESILRDVAEGLRKWLNQQSAL